MFDERVAIPDLSGLASVGKFAPVILVTLFGVVGLTFLDKQRTGKFMNELFCSLLQVVIGGFIAYNLMQFLVG